MVKPIRTDVSSTEPYGPELDACAIYLGIRKRGLSTHNTLARALSAVRNMSDSTRMSRPQTGFSAHIS
ncbi:MAG: hypothetical protein ACC700_12070 [Anaerolineales bacterium]